MNTDPMDTDRQLFIMNKNKSSQSTKFSKYDRILKPEKFENLKFTFDFEVIREPS
jgi:hypothetical protein